jgi:hypothetical protein
MLAMRGRLKRHGTPRRALYDLAELIERKALESNGEDEPQCITP